MNSDQFIASCIKKYIMDPERLNTLCPRIVSSPPIMRQNLIHRIPTEVLMNNTNNSIEDDNFFENLKFKLGSNPIKHLKENCVVNKSNTTRKRKHGFIEKSHSIIKRFQENIENRNIENLNNYKSCIHVKDTSKSGFICHSNNSNTFKPLEKILNDQISIRREETMNMLTIPKDTESVMSHKTTFDTEIQETLVNEVFYLTPPK